MKIIDKIRNILVMMNLPNTESGIRSIFKYASNVVYVLSLKGPRTTKALGINKYCCTSMHNIYPQIDLEFDTLQMIKSLQNIVIEIREKYSHCCDI